MPWGSVLSGHIALFRYRLAPAFPGHLVGADHCPRRQDSVFWDHHDPVPHDPVFAIHLCARSELTDDDALAQPGVLIDDGALDLAVLTDADWDPLRW